MQEKTIPYEVSVKPWNVAGTDIFMMNNKNLLYIIDYYSKFLVVKKLESLSAKNVIQVAKVVCAEFGLPKK